MSFRRVADGIGAGCARVGNDANRPAMAESVQHRPTLNLRLVARRLVG